MKNKKSIIIALVVGMLIGTVTSSFAGMWVQAYKNDQVKVSFNGVVQTFKDETTGEVMYPLTYEDRTYLPLRNVANLAGLKVDYDAATNTAILKTSDYVEPVKPVEPVEPGTNEEPQLNNTFIIGEDPYFKSLNLYEVSNSKAEATILRNTATVVELLCTLGRKNSVAKPAELINSKSPIFDDLVRDFTDIGTSAEKANQSVVVKNGKVLNVYASSNKANNAFEGYAGAKVEFDLYTGKDAFIAHLTVLMITDQSNNNILSLFCFVG